MPRSVADYMLSRLSEWGVHRIFGYPGDGINAFLSAPSSAPAATGSSSRPASKTQIEHATGRRALHLVEVVEFAADRERVGDYPERALSNGNGRRHT